MDFLAYIFLVLAVWQWLRKRHYRKRWKRSVEDAGDLRRANQLLQDRNHRLFRSMFGKPCAEDEWPEVIEK